MDGFIDPHNKPYIWIYKKGNEDIIKATSTDIAVEKHYFSYRTPNGSRDSNTLENALEKIEELVQFDEIKKLVSFYRTSKRGVVGMDSDIN